MKYITIKVDDVDDIVIEDLKEAYDLAAKPDRVDCSDDELEPDFNLLRAIDTVLDYYMSYGEYNEWVRTRRVVEE